MSEHADDAKAIFEFWKDATKHTRSHLDDKRKKLIFARLKEGYGRDDLMLAIIGCTASKFHMGENDAGKVYDALELILRDAGKVDWFLKMGENEMARRRREKEQEEKRRAETLQASVPGDGYKNARGQLLSLVKKTA